MPKTAVTSIPGIGKTFAKDFARIDMHCIEDFQKKQADSVFEALATANQQDNHKTNKITCM